MKTIPDYDLQKVYFIAFTSSLGSLNWGYHLSIFNSLRIFLQNNVFPDASNRDIALIASTLTVGAALGSLASGKLVTTLGRRGALLFSDFLAMGATLLTTIPDLYIILLGRLMIGFIIGISSSVVPLYNVEMAPLEKKGKMSAISMLLLAFGLLLGYMAGLFVPTTIEGKDSQVWRILFGFPILINLLRASIFLRILKLDTPFYLCLQGEIDQARVALGQVYNNNIDQYLDKVIKDKEASTSSLGSLSFMDLFTQKYRKAFFMGMLLTSGVQLCGFSPIFMFFSVFAKESAHGDLDTLVFFSTMLGLVSFAFTFVTTMIIEKFGRRPLLIFGMAGIASIKILYVLISVVSGPDHPILKYLLVFWPVFYRFTTGTLAFVYISEVLPGIGVTFATFINWICAFLTLQTFLPLVEMIGIESLMLLYAAFCITSVLIYNKYLIESKGRTKAELIGLYNGRIKEEMLDRKETEMHKVPLLLTRPSQVYSKV